MRSPSIEFHLSGVVFYMITDCLRNFQEKFQKALVSKTKVCRIGIRQVPMKGALYDYHIEAPDRRRRVEPDKAGNGGKPRNKHKPFVHEIVRAVELAISIGRPERHELPQFAQETRQPRENSIARVA